jgi:hypothetical protein
MKIYKTQQEVESDIKDGVLYIEDDVIFECSISINAFIYARDINAGDIKAGDIKAWDINFYAVCFAYQSFVCESIVSRRDRSKYFCLDSKVVIKQAKNKGGPK